MQMRAGDSTRQQICPALRVHTLFPSAHKLLTAHRCPLHCASGFSDILLNHAGPESEKCKSCHFSFSFHLCQPLTSLSSIQWLFSTLSHKGVACFERERERGSSRQSLFSSQTQTDNRDDGEVVFFSSKRYQQLL